METPTLDHTTNNEAEAYITIRDAILTLMSRYGPLFTKTMLTSHIATYSNRFNYSWHKVLDDLVNNGTIIRSVSAYDAGDYRFNPAVIYILASRQHEIPNTDIS